MTNSIQSFWYKSSSLFEEMREDKRTSSKSDDLLMELRHTFWKNGMFSSYLQHMSRRSNTLQLVWKGKKKHTYAFDLENAVLERNGGQTFFRDFHWGMDAWAATSLGSIPWNILKASLFWKSLLEPTQIIRLPDIELKEFLIQISIFQIKNELLLLSYRDALNLLNATFHFPYNIFMSRIHGKCYHTMSPCQLINAGCWLEHGSSVTCLN